MAANFITFFIPFSLMVQECPSNYITISLSSSPIPHLFPKIPQFFHTHGLIVILTLKHTHALKHPNTTNLLLFCASTLVAFIVHIKINVK
jgi:hypothetical protein